MAYAEYDRLDQNGQSNAACHGVKLLLKIAAKSQFLANTCRESKRYPHHAFKNSLGKKPPRGICSTTQHMRIHQSDPQRPDACGHNDVFQDVCWRRPPAPNKIAQTHSALLHAHPNIQHQEPFRDDHGKVAWHGVSAACCCVWMLVYGVLKETANDSQPHENNNEHNRMPHRSDEPAVGWVGSRARVCGHRASSAHSVPSRAPRSPEK